MNKSWRRNLEPSFYRTSSCGFQLLIPLFASFFFVEKNQHENNLHKPPVCSIDKHHANTVASDFFPVPDKKESTLSKHGNDPIKAVLQRWMGPVEPRLNSHPRKRQRDMSEEPTICFYLRDNEQWKCARGDQSDVMFKEFRVRSVKAAAVVSASKLFPVFWGKKWRTAALADFLCWIWGHSILCHYTGCRSLKLCTGNCGLNKN